MSQLFKALVGILMLPLGAAFAMTVVGLLRVVPLESLAWMAGGFLGFTALYLLLANTNNMNFVRVWEHELNHMFFSLITGRSLKLDGKREIDDTR